MPKIIENLSEKLLTEARRQVQEAGYAALNIRSVAKNCGVSVGAVYNYYPSKDALVAGFLLEDWRSSLSRIRGTAEESFPAVLEAIYRELYAFLTRYEELFRSASDSVPASPRQYHRLMRNQLAELLLPTCPNRFHADFAAEAMLTWTVEGIPFPQLRDLIVKMTDE